MQFTAPLIVTLKANPEIGTGIVIGGETYMDIEKDEEGNVVRDANNQPVVVKKRDVYVHWTKDPSDIYVHQLNELRVLEVVAVRTLDEMKDEVKEELRDDIDALRNEILDILDEPEDDDGNGEPAGEDDKNPETQE